MFLSVWSFLRIVCFEFHGQSLVVHESSPLIWSAGDVYWMFLSHMIKKVRCWYIHLQNLVILFGHMLGFIYQHNGAYRLWHCGSTRRSIMKSAQFLQFFGSMCKVGYKVVWCPRSMAKFVMA